MVEISTPDWAEDWDQSLIVLTRSGDDYSQPASTRGGYT